AESLVRQGSRDPAHQVRRPGQRVSPGQVHLRPMEGVRSVAEVLMLAAFEGYSFIPTSFGGKAANLGTREEAAKLRELTDKTQIIDHLNKGFAHAKKELEGLDASAMTGKRKVM